MVWAAAAIMAASAIASFMQSQQAQGMTEAERAKMAALANAIQEPNFDWNTIQPEEYKLVAAYVPQAASYIEDQAPEVIKKTQDMEAGRSAQMDAMRYMQGIAARGDDPMAELDRIRGARQAAMESNTQRQNIESSMARRGVGDSGMDLVAQQAAAGEAGYRTAMAGEEAARNAQETRMGAMSQAAGIGGQVFGQDLSMEEKNANIINDFNARMGARRQQLATLNTGVANQAGAAAQAAAQGNLDRNTTLRNTAARAEQDRLNGLRQTQYSNAINKVGLQTGQGAGRIADIQAGSAATQKAIAGAGKMGASVAARYDQYGNELPAEDDEYRPQDYQAPRSGSRAV